jgi:diguanylate cyclase (GGDEF)-like protein
MLNIAFATVAFGPWVGAATAVVSIPLIAWLEGLTHGDSRPHGEWPILLVVLLALVALLTRINRLQQDALFDAVTSLRNHRYFQVRLREELLRSDRTGRPTALVLLDLDNFKRVNDRFGHAVGDYVLSQVARVLEQNARSADVVCRYGGEEIAVILPETGPVEAAQAAERLRQMVEKRNDRPGPAVTVSAGVAAYPSDAASSDALIAAADAALYQAKGAGKNRVMSAPHLAEVAPVEGGNGEGPAPLGDRAAR